MKEKNAPRSLWIHLRISPDEMKILNQGFEKSLCRKRSDYARRILLGKPVVLKYRNVSVDEFILEIARLRADLNAAGNNYNQAVKKLHSLGENSEFQQWISSSETQRKMLFDSIEKIKEAMIKTAEKWLQ